MKTSLSNPATQSFRTYPVSRMPIPATRRRVRECVTGGIFAALLALTSMNADASIAYGSINNFDTVNDTGHECHGFEI